MRSVPSSVKGKMMPVTRSRPIFAKPVNFGGIVGREIDGHVEILTKNKKNCRKDDPDVKNWISNYLEQQELPSSTCSIGTTVLSEACCDDAAPLVASFIGCNSIAWSVFSAIFFWYVQMERTKQNVVVLILISSLLPFNWHQHWSSEYLSWSVIKKIRVASGFSRFFYTTWIF